MGSEKRLQKASQDSLTFLDHNCGLDIYSEPAGIRQCSIVCTIGPNTKSVEMLTALRKEGMNVVRMNFSHGSYEYHGSVIAAARESEKLHPLDGRPVAIALDTKGPEIRTGMLVGEDPVLEKGSTLTVHTDEAWREKCDKDNIFMDYKNLPGVISVGGFIFVDDGLISLKVTAIDKAAGTLTCAVENSGKLGSRKGCNLPNVDVDLPALSEKDQKDLAWGVGQKVDMVFASFIRKKQDVIDVRTCLVAADPEVGKRVQIISKIENHEGMRNFDEILEVTDGVMVARGDLGIEIPPQKVFIAQKMMIAKCNRVAKPIICATQMLESMTFNPRPTRAEVSDVANAVLDGADCVMLSGETAKGAYPLEAVRMMAETCCEAESAMCYRQLHADLNGAMKGPVDTTAAVAASAVVSASTSDAAAIIVLSVTGNTTRLVSKFRPRCPILAISRDPMTCRIAHLYRGVYPFHYAAERDASAAWEADVSSRIQWAMAKGVEMGALRSGDKIVAVHGWKSGDSSTNTVRSLVVP